MGAIREEFPQVLAREVSRLVAKLAYQQQAVLETIQRLEVRTGTMRMSSTSIGTFTTSIAIPSYRE